MQKNHNDKCLQFSVLRQLIDIFPSLLQAFCDDKTTQGQVKPPLCLPTFPRNRPPRVTAAAEYLLSIFRVLGSSPREEKSCVYNPST